MVEKRKGNDACALENSTERNVINKSWNRETADTDEKFLFKHTV